MGLLHLTLPLATLAGHASEPGHLTRIGPITAAQARELAVCAIADPAARWRVILVDGTGRALAVTKIRRASRVAAPVGASPSGSPAAGISPAGQVTVIVTEADLASPDDYVAHPDLIISQILTAAIKAAALAGATIGPDGNCGHLAATTAYRPPPRLKEYVAARDITCRFPTCRQPVWHCDLDHTIPYDKGGRTCSCNLGGLCRFHHQLKQHFRWRLVQATPGVFQWTAPSGRSYMTVPDPH